MSIPDRLGRIMRHKLNEIKDKFDQLDEEALADPAEIERLRRAEARLAAKQEMEEAMQSPGYASANAGVRSSETRTTAPLTAPAPTSAPSSGARMRTPEEITGAARPSSSHQSQISDPLAAHYKMLGLPPGAELAEVQRAYNSLSARISSSQFAAGSPEARELDEIRDRLEGSYKALREALDTTAHRFGMLEFDPRPAGNG